MADALKLPGYPGFGGCDLFFIGSENCPCRPWAWTRAEGRSGFEGRVGHEKARRPSRRAMADVVGISYHRPSRLSERSDNFDAYSTEFLCSLNSLVGLKQLVGQIGAKIDVEVRGLVKTFHAARVVLVSLWPAFLLAADLGRIPYPARRLLVAAILVDVRLRLFRAVFLLHRRAVGTHVTNHGIAVFRPRASFVGGGRPNQTPQRPAACRIARRAARCPPGHFRHAGRN